MLLRNCGRLLGMGLATMILTHQAAAHGAQPPQDNLYAARVIVDQSVVRINALLGRIFGGGSSSGGWGGGGGGDFPSEPFPGQPGEGGYPGGEHQPYPRILGLNAETEGAYAEEGELENDKIAGLALQGLGAGMTHLGQLIDQANAHYYDPSFWMYQEQACFKTTLLIKGANGGKVSAVIPLQGILTPQDFVEIEQEAYAVRGQLYCP